MNVAKAARLTGQAVCVLIAAASAVLVVAIVIGSTSNSREFTAFACIVALFVGLAPLAVGFFVQFAVDDSWAALVWVGCALSGVVVGFSIVAAAVSPFA